VDCQENKEGETLNLTDATKVAEDIVATLRPLCLRCEVAGSVRRKKTNDIKDIEVCIVPAPQFYRELSAIINAKWGRPSQGLWPSKYCKIRTHVSIDLFTCTRETWGLIYFIRTGPAEFSMRALAFWKTITNGGYSEEGILHLADGTPVPTLEEEDVFKVFSHYSGKPVPFVPPDRRFSEKRPSTR
jgi:DNA polymerase/3'-5' exonuclease PolX